MPTIEQVIQWIENGKQLGKTFSFEINGKTIWSSVGIQKWEGIYKVYVDEIAQENMHAEKYTRDEIRSFGNGMEALNYIEQHTRSKVSDLQVCKGRRIFNPNF